MDLDLIVSGGTFFDGTGAPPRRADVGIRDGRVVTVSEVPLEPGSGTRVVDAAGRWVMPGFVDAHTHYDAELTVAPGLNESVRHGVTTVLVGNCSISAVYSSPEFGSGREALHLRDEMRNEMLQEEAYRRWFRQDFGKRFSPRVWHRDFDDATVTECPDASLVGRTIGDVARERGVHPVDCYLDLVVEHGTGLRWTTPIANTRPKVQERLLRTPGITIGFSDAGAHLRNMAFYDFGLCLLRTVHEAQRERRPFMSVEQAVHKLTGELADFYGVDAGRLHEGARADLVVVDPAGLTSAVDGYHEAVFEELGGISRMVNRNDAAVHATVVSGTAVYEAGEFADGYGRDFATGRFLPAGERAPMTKRAVAAPARAEATA